MIRFQDFGADLFQIFHKDMDDKTTLAYQYDFLHLHYDRFHISFDILPTYIGILYRWKGICNDTNCAKILFFNFEITLLEKCINYVNIYSSNVCLFNDLTPLFFIILTCCIDRFSDSSFLNLGD